MFLDDKIQEDEEVIFYLINNGFYFAWSIVYTPNY